jgi:hypothetical protein
VQQRFDGAGTREVEEDTVLILDIIANKLLSLPAGNSKVV